MTPRTAFRSPYVWGFLIGVVMLTAIRPFLRRDPEPPPVLAPWPEFSLLGTDARPFGSAELRGQVYIVNFFSTSCRSNCPADMRGIARLQEGYALKRVKGIRLVSISVDPEHDTPDVLDQYASGLGVDASRWTILTGDPAEVRRLVVDGLKTTIDGAHTGRLVLVDGSGRVRGTYEFSEVGLDEVYNRAQHVLRQEREARGSR